jgi:hypothetical protein
MGFFNGISSLIYKHATTTRLNFSSRCNVDTLLPTSTTQLDFTSRCNVDAPRPPTSTTWLNFVLCRNIHTQQQRVRLLRLREDDRRLADYYINYSSRLENYSESIPTSRASSTNRRSVINKLHGFVDIRPRIKLSDLYLFRLVLHKIGYLFGYASRRA